MIDSTATLAASAMATRESVRISTVRGTGEHFIALVRGDEVVMPIGPEAISDDLVEGIAAWWAAAYGVDVSRRDVDTYRIWEG